MNSSDTEYASPQILERPTPQNTAVTRRGRQLPLHPMLAECSFRFVQLIIGFRLLKDDIIRHLHFSLIQSMHLPKF